MRNDSFAGQQAATDSRRGGRRDAMNPFLEWALAYFRPRRKLSTTGEKSHYSASQK